VKYLFIFIFCYVSLQADIALVSTKSIKFKQKLEYGDLQVQYSDKKIHCTMFDKQKLLDNSYQAIRYIPKFKPICEKDVKLVIDHKVRVDFGNIIIEKNGEYIGETKEYIKIKKNDGTVERINKNGM
jgi:hypothetical protein